MIVMQKLHFPAIDLICSIEHDHAFNLASRIKNAYLAGTKSRAGFCIADCLIFLQEHGFNAG